MLKSSVRRSPTWFRAPTEGGPESACIGEAGNIDTHTYANAGVTCAPFHCHGVSIFFQMNDRLSNSERSIRVRHPGAYVILFPRNLEQVIRVYLASAPAIIFQIAEGNIISMFGITHSNNTRFDQERTSECRCFLSLWNSSFRWFDKPFDTVSTSPIPITTL
ncbi:uncharacterized protein K460DRAFT_144243 [Cucurbitaria berberidis CBS 394.84]|uniref:Uncharacterized protein n=1 Tax=Cucurbitaria berberidis CBS 394.84 TaxID=1168544 RepID=A0A9P4GCI5_9PLEO|nr:uncharacterized protein K460DRAFT_144243 [Cucurbitaria berberidis CBS 394.84]KAF1843373.1 hypothetical protein K460DRAFT_144243 [Cucurbitaria berberidis CBS 394.84]